LGFDGIAGVEQQVDEHLFQPAGVGIDARKRLPDFPHHLDAPHLELLAEDFKGAFQHVVELD
jgi:hypothetical protein